MLNVATFLRTAESQFGKTRGQNLGSFDIRGSIANGALTTFSKFESLDEQSGTEIKTITSTKR